MSEHITPKQILTSEPIPFSPYATDLTVEDATPTLLSVDVSRDTLEDEMLRTYLQVMRDRQSSERIKAAGQVSEILGLRGKQSSTTVIANNAQINQQLPPALKNHLLDASTGLRTLSDSSDANIRIKESGHG